MKFYTLYVDFTPAAFVIRAEGIPKFRLSTSLDIQVTGKGSKESTSNRGASFRPFRFWRLRND